jgi:hypothetical protein
MFYNTKSTAKGIAALLLLSATFSACDKHDHGTEGELITTIQVHLTGPGLDKTFLWNDEDGDGGSAPAIDTIALPPLTGSITCELSVFDRSKDPDENITEEIEAESADHLFTYTINGADFNITYADQDANGKNFGLKTLWVSDQPSTGSLNIKLFHEPADKSNLNSPGGDEDFNVVFPVVIR